MRFFKFTQELQNFKREIRYTTLTFLDLQTDVTKVQSAIKNLSTFIEREKTNQASINTDIFVHQKNISNVIKGKNQPPPSFFHCKSKMLTILNILIIITTQTIDIIISNELDFS